MGLKLNSLKVKTIIEWLRSINVIEIRNFMGSAGYYQRFLKQFFKDNIFSDQFVEKSYSA